eukprot:Skav227867  [mRNA]  locus=scaffold383:337699:339303:+ [translate_table: standard]
MRRRQLTTLSPSAFQLCEGFFASETADSVPILPTVDPSRSGVCLVEYEEAMKWAWKPLPIVPDPLAIVMIHNDEDFSGGPRPEMLTFPALDSKARRVILRGAMWQLGESKVTVKAKMHQLELPETIVVAATVWRDEASPEFWEACSKNLVKTVIQALELQDRSIILEVWGRTFRDTKQKCEPDQAVSGQFHFRTHRSQIDDLLQMSGKGATYFTPKSEAKLSHDDWSMIWFRDKTEASIALSRTGTHSGLARTRDKWALRVPSNHFTQVFQEVKPDEDIRANVSVKKLYKVQPIPPGITNEHVLQWTAQMKWPTRVLKKLGKDAYLLGAATDPPEENVYLNGTLMLIKQVGNAKIMNKNPNPLLAGPKQFASKKGSESKVDKLEPLEDSWAAYRAMKGIPAPSVAAGSQATNGVPASGSQQIEAPIAARFAAFEKRMAFLETGFERLDNGQSEMVREITKNGSQIQQVESQLNDVNRQIQGGIEMAFAKSMQEQSRQLDQKFSQLASMLQANVCKRQQPEPGDAWMDSPLKDAK